MHFSRIACFHNEAHKRALFLANEMMMNCTRHQQRRNWCMNFIRVAVRQNDDASTIVNCRFYFATYTCECFTQRVSAATHTKETRNDCRLQMRQVAIVIDVNNASKVVVVDDGERHRELATCFWPSGKKVCFWPHGTAYCCDHFFADGVEWRVSHLRK